MAVFHSLRNQSPFVSNIRTILQYYHRQSKIACCLSKSFMSSCINKNGENKLCSTITGFDSLIDKLKTNVEIKDWLTRGDIEIPESSIVKSQDELELRTPGDSYQEFILPLGQNPQEREKFLNIYGFVRVGKILECMDVFAVWVGFNYYKGPTEKPFNLVTACVDSIDFSACQPLSNQDLKLKGFVSWAGKTSLEVTIFLEQQGFTGEWKEISKAVFKLAARSVTGTGGAIINKMNPQTEEEMKYFKQGEINTNTQKTKAQESLMKTAPTGEELEIIHNMFIKTLDSDRATFRVQNKPANTVWMEDTILKNLIICQPQSRNVYNKIFGGFLMRVALELSFASASVHMKSRPVITGIDDIIFRKPVEIGSLLYLSSAIVYTGDQYLQTRVVAENLDPKTGKKVTTNTFHFHFASENNIDQVIPKSYGEYILYINGRRHCPLHLRKDK